ncbi:MAG: type II toxin-antitoxin system RelE/ParE family toxin [Bacillota bacterium]|nr:type II toxin-antitoxin system RelE/ParE family toxin [Bacillota bacterium]MDW7677225.1 type II toxin-antitoxin system RelE/ParE family toxin [Bacillota bacterium]
MNVWFYTTRGGKNVIKEFINHLPIYEKAEGMAIIEGLEENGIPYLDILNTRQLDRKLWEIKFYRHNRIMYVLMDDDNIYLLHACKKQKGKAETFELNKAKKRALEVE